MKRPYSSLLNFVEVQIEVALRIVVEAAELLQLRTQRLEHRSRIKYSSNTNKSIKKEVSSDFTDPHLLIAMAYTPARLVSHVNFTKFSDIMTFANVPHMLKID